VSIDVSVIALQGRDAMASAIQTSGTRVDLFIDADDIDDQVNFETLEITDPTPGRASATNLPALIVSEGATAENVGPARETRPGIYRVSLLPAAPEIPEGAVLLIRKCLNNALVNARLQVTETVDDAFGLARTSRATRIR
jgi:hypothetical protein